MEADLLDEVRAQWAARTGYVAQGASWCVCDDRSCRVCERKAANRLDRRRRDAAEREADGT